MSCSLSVNFAVVLLFLGLFLQTFVFEDYFSVKDLIWNSKKVNISKPSCDIIIGVLSARDHFELRKSLRETWVGYIKHHEHLKNRLLVKFIVGNKACLIPVKDRQDPYSCEKNGLTNPVLNKDITAYQVPKGTIGHHVHPGPIGMDFKVNIPIVVSQLGVFDSNSDGFKHGLVVRLYDRVTQVEVVNASFTPDDPGQLIGGSRFKPVDQYILPKGFQASIVAENFSILDPSHDRPVEHGTVDSGGGLISFTRVSRFGMVQGVFPDIEESAIEDQHDYAAGTFVYHAYVFNSGEFSEENQSKKQQEARAREEERLKIIKREEEQLQEENLEYGDLLVVDAVDVYRNLPRKMLLFYKWASENVEFNFTLKTDDDCFLNIDSILNDLKVYGLYNKSKLWWSGFRIDWPVERYGKWQEPDYSASVYPAFACGAGNMLSADLVKWLAQNANILKSYQGEDVSLGIWLSAVGPMLVKDYRWTCAKGCSKDMYTSPENGPQELIELWTNLKQCNDPCGCT